ncbi:MAG: hypothetical protein ACYCS9_01175 [Candidatus Dormibacteria bacterium]
MPLQRGHATSDAQPLPPPAVHRPHRHPRPTYLSPSPLPPKGSICEGAPHLGRKSESLSPQFASADFDEIRRPGAARVALAEITGFSPAL